VNKNELDFAVFCIEAIAEYLDINGADVYTKLKYESDLLDEYIVANYDALHTQGKEYIVEDIVEIMQEEGLVE